MADRLTPQQARAIRDAIAIGQAFADHLHSMRRMEACIFGADGSGPGHVVMPEDVAKHGPVIALGGFVADLRGWYRALDELRYALPDADVPYPSRLPFDAADDPRSTEAPPEEPSC